MRCLTQRHASHIVLLNSPYSAWDYTDPETAVLGTAFHALEWIIVRIVPAALIGAVVEAVFTRKKV